MRAGSSFHGRRKPNGSACHRRTIAGVQDEAKHAMSAMSPLKSCDVETPQPSGRCRTRRWCLWRWPCWRRATSRPRTEALGGLALLLYRNLPRDAETADPDRAPAKPLGRSRSIVLTLAALFSLHAFAAGLVVQSLLALWLFERFGLSLAAAGAIFFWTGVLLTLSYFAAAWLADRIGLINTMGVHAPAGQSVPRAPGPRTSWRLSRRRSSPPPPA
jgi:hypothetical protein